MREYGEQFVTTYGTRLMLMYVCVLGGRGVVGVCECACGGVHIVRLVIFKG